MKDNDVTRGMHFRPMRNGAYYVTAGLVSTMMEYVDFEPKTVFDPLVSDGILFDQLPDEVEKYGQDRDLQELQRADELLVNFEGYQVYNIVNDDWKDRQFDLIMTAIPLAVTGKFPSLSLSDQPYCLSSPEKKTEQAYARMIIHCLADDGKAIILCEPGLLRRGGNEGSARKWLVQTNYVERIVNIPEGTLEDTAFPMVIVVLSKHKEVKDIILEDKKLGKERIVPYNEVCDHDYDLSVENYLK